MELSHLYYLPKAHKLNTPLRPIVAGLKHPTVKISKYLDGLLRPCFDQMAIENTGMFQLVTFFFDRAFVRKKSGLS